MKKILRTALLTLLFTFIFFQPIQAGSKADGQLCHDSSECASNNCDYNTYGYRVCISTAVPDYSGDNSSGDLEVTNETLDQFDPLKIGNSKFQEDLSTPGGIISRALDFAFPLAGIALFLMLVVGGFQILMAAGNDKGMQAGQQRITFAVIGFMLLFASYWIAVILGQILNIKLV